MRYEDGCIISPDGTPMFVCPKCGEPVSAFASACSNCGRLPTKQDRIKCGAIRDSDGNAMIICPECENLVSITASFCGYCGRQPTSQDWKTCIGCGSVLESEDRFCRFCGKAVWEDT